MPLAARLAAVSAGLTAIAASGAAIQHADPPLVLLAIAAIFALASPLAAIPLRTFPAYGLLMPLLIASAGTTFAIGGQLTRGAGILLAIAGAIALVFAAWAPSLTARIDRVSGAAPPSSA
jgi:hypothetical protein